MAVKNLFSNTTNIVDKKRLEYKNNFVQLGVVQTVDSEKGIMDVLLSSNKLVPNIPYVYNVQATGHADISVPVPGDIVYIYQDAVVHGMHLGPAPRDYSALIQDKAVTKDIKSTDPLSLPYVDSGERYMRSSKGAAFHLSDNVILQDAIANKIFLDSNEDQAVTYAGTVVDNSYLTEVRSGLTKRYNPDINLVYDAIIKDPAVASSDGMSEFTVFVGKSLVEGIAPDEYLYGSSDGVQSEEFNFDIGKDETPDITFSLSSGSVVGINGTEFPELNGIKLNMLMQIADRFSFMVNQTGSALIGKIGTSSFTGILMDTTPGSETMSIGLAVGNGLIFQSLGGVLLQSPVINGSNARLNLSANGSITLANSKYNMFVSNKAGEESFQMTFAGDSKFMLRCDADGTNLAAGDATWVFKKDGTVQMNQKVANIGQPNPTGLNGPYEPAMMGTTATQLFAEVLESISTLHTALLQPLIGAASFNPLTVSAVGALTAKMTAIGAKYGITVSPTPGSVSSSVTIPATPLRSKQVNIGA